MGDQWETLSVLIALEFVVMAAVVLLLVPFEAAFWVIPLFVVLLLALSVYWT